MVTKWTRPRTRTYNFTPFELKERTKVFWEQVYRVGEPPMSQVQTEWNPSAKFTIEELKIIGEVNANRAPGIDGVTYATLKAAIKYDG